MEKLVQRMDGLGDVASEIVPNLSKSKQIPETVVYGNNSSSDLIFNVDLFNDYFPSIYKRSQGDVNLTYPDVINPKLLSDLSVSACDVQKILPNIN